MVCSWEVAVAYWGDSNLEKTYITAWAHLIGWTGVESVSLMGVFCALRLFDHPGRLLYTVTCS